MAPSWADLLTGCSSGDVLITFADVGVQLYHGTELCLNTDHGWCFVLALNLPATRCGYCPEWFDGGLAFPPSIVNLRPPPLGDPHRLTFRGLLQHSSNRLCFAEGGRISLGRFETAAAAGCLLTAAGHSTLPHLGLLPYFLHRQFGVENVDVRSRAAAVAYWLKTNVAEPRMRLNHARVVPDAWRRARRGDGWVLCRIPHRLPQSPLAGHRPVSSSNPPLAVGWSLKLVDARQRRIVWAVDEVFDAGKPAVASSARGYYARSIYEQATLRDSNGILGSPRWFGQYAAAAALETLPAR